MKVEVLKDLSVDFVFDNEFDGKDFANILSKFGLVIPFIFVFGVGVKAPHDQLDHDYSGRHGNLRYISSTRGILSGLARKGK